MKKSILASLLLYSFAIAAQQPADRLQYQPVQHGFYRQILEDGGKTPAPRPDEKPVALPARRQFPLQPALYTKVWHQPPLSQGETGTCWCFAAVSFLESEAKRITGNEIKLSEMYFVYYEYLERSAEFVRTRGGITFAEGSESSSVPLLLEKYGALPAGAYPGKPAHFRFHHHRQMVSEMQAYLEHVQLSNAWDFDAVDRVIRSILNNYMGPPPAAFMMGGQNFSPLRFAREVLRLLPSDYVHFMSNIRQPVNQRGELVEDDNWRRFDAYYNVSLSDFAILVRNANENGYSVCICGDVSEPGFDKTTGAAYIPDFDIPSTHINEFARELRLYNGTTTDDHCMHLIGVARSASGYWFMAKDSGSGAFDTPVPGYRFIHEDYIRLKMMNIMVHKEAARPVLDKIIK